MPRWVDLSHQYVEDMPAWPTHARYARHIVETFPESVAEHAAITLDEHTGTHLDAPAHFVPGGISVERLPLERFSGPGCVIDASALPPLGRLTKKALQAWEVEQGRIVPGSIVLCYFGWGPRWGNRNVEPAFEEQWPGLDGEAAQYLVDCGVAAVGTDALSIDPADSADLAAHRTLLGAGVPIYENVANLEQLIGRSFTFYGWPLAIHRGSGSPVRAVAWMPEDV